MGFVFGATSVVEAYDSTVSDDMVSDNATMAQSTPKKSRTKQCNKDCQARKNQMKNKNRRSIEKEEMHKSPKEEMRCIERKLDKIVKQLHNDGDVKAAKRELRAIPAKIDHCIDRMENSSEHRSMASIHRKTLDRKLEEARKAVREYAEKHSK